MKIIPLTFILIIFSSIAYSLELSNPPPVGLLLFPEMKVFEGNPSEGPHGLKEYCYKVNDQYVVYSVNLLGEGYAFYKAKPDNQCLIPEGRINQENNLGLSLGISQEKASELLGVKLAEGNNKIVWLYQRPIHNRPYDDMTILDITIKNGLVYAVSLFNTVTS